MLIKLLSYEQDPAVRVTQKLTLIYTTRKHQGMRRPPHPQHAKVSPPSQTTVPSLIVEFFRITVMPDRM